MEYSRYPQDPKVYQSWIDAILDESQDKLSAWELDFISSIQNRASNLSEKQANVLERIYAEKTA